MRLEDPRFRNKTASEIIERTKEDLGVLPVTDTVNIPITEVGGGFEHAGVHDDLETKSIHNFRGKAQDAHKCPEDKQTITYFSNNELLTEQFYHEFEDFDVWCLPSELKLLIKNVWNCDGTFSHSNDLIRVVDGSKVSFRQTYIISVKFEFEHGVFCYPVVF